MTAFQHQHAEADRLFQAGRLEDAVAAWRQILAAAPRDGVANRKLGMVAIMTGHFEPARRLMETALSADPSDAEAWVHHGVALQNLGQDAEASFTKALTLQPVYPEALFSLAALREMQGRPDDAAAAYAKAAAQRPDFAEAHNNLGNVLTQLGRLEEAAAAFARALAIRPDYAEAHSNYGNLLQEQGRPDEAMAAFRAALALRPDLAEAHNNLGNAFKDQGKLEDAALCYRRALAQRPDYALAAENLALLLADQGRGGEAMQIIKQLLRGESRQAQSIFVECARHTRFTQNDGELRALMVRALMEPWGRPAGLTKSALGLALLDAEMAACVTALPLQPSAQALFAAPGFDRLARDPLLRALLVSGPLCDIAMERFFTAVRHALLQRASDEQPVNDSVLAFFAALARQCFINEYVFAASEDELGRADMLREAATAMLEAGVAPPALWLVAMAAYMPLASPPQAERLLTQSWPAPVMEILTQQIGEPLQELADRGALPTLSPIDATSLAVRRQYEESPFPRWVRTAPSAGPKPLAQYLAQKFPFASFDRATLAGPARILVAGCGTGQQAVEAAWDFAGAQMLAVDLSLASLAYARRKTRELGMTSIRYAQADLLTLKDAGPFDVIACTGVLHHLADPLAGWKNLLKLLRPGGVMKIGLYSELARRHVVRLRAFIAERGYSGTPDDIRRFRQDVLASSDPDFRKAAQAYDFFSLSMCRDLFFHVQEQRFSLTQIDAFLKENGLTFLGFDIEPSLRNAYRAPFPGDPAATNLAQWQEFETYHPDSFTEMYQFWIQKPA